MSQFKDPKFMSKYDYNLYYSDTDSIYIDSPLPEKFISNTRLGALKLEGIYDKAIFLAPKVYALKFNNEEIIKIKGLSKESIWKRGLNIEILETLLKKDSDLKLTQDKWFKSLAEGSIQILEQTYSLKVTANKRKLIYNSEQILVNTSPILIK
jgi:DNA polymerase elongation subunit (family B)